MIYSLDIMEDMIRSNLNESTEKRISSTEITAAINDGYKFVVTRGLCHEKEIYHVTTSGVDIIPRPGVRVNYIELIGLEGYSYFIDTEDTIWTDDDVEWYATAGTTVTGKGLHCILPTNLGHIPTSGTAPQHWFNWGKYIILHPVPDNKYILKLHYADYPTVLANDWETLLIPKEFCPCVVDFAEAVLSIKLKRWLEVATLYNKCIIGIQRAKDQYVKRYADLRAAREVPEDVQEAVNG